MLELARETISGTPGTAAGLTVAAITGAVAYPRLHAVGAVGLPVYYTIESSAGQVLCSGVGVSTGAGAFTRVKEISAWDGTTYTFGPSGLASLPSGCSIYCGASAANLDSLALPVKTQTWLDPGRRPWTAATLTMTASRDHFWRLPNKYPWRVDAIAVHLAAIATIDVGLYAPKGADGDPGVLLLGWQGVSAAAGMNTLTLASATLGSLPKAAQALPTGDLVAMLNVSTSGAGRVVDESAGTTGSLVSDLTAAQGVLYANRTNNTAFGDNPTITGRLTTGFQRVPALALRAE